MREIKIDLATAQRWYESNNEELKALALQTYPELEKKVDSWEVLGSVSGWFASNNSIVIDTKDLSANNNNRNVFATKEQAEASIAMAQLSQLMAKVNGDWVPNWQDYREIKHCIRFAMKIPEYNAFSAFKHFLCFKDRETAEIFLENHRELILKAEPLL